MITGCDFIVLSDDWNGLPTSTIHLFRRISRRNRVFWFNTINHMRWLSPKDTGKVVRFFCDRRETSRSMKQRVTGCSDAPLDGMWVVSPFMIPWFKPLVRRFNCARLLRKYERLSKDCKIRDPIVVTTFPSAVDFMKSISPALSIYYCVDEWLDYPNVNVADWRAMEEELLENIDAFVATSRDLQKKCRPSCPSLYLPHGVDFNHFYQDGVTREPATRMQDIPRPIVGFFGVIGQWVDLNLVAALSRTFPEVSFVLIGKPQVSMAAVSGCRNVHYLGTVPYADLPRYASSFHVGLIPFLRNKLTEAVNPLKLLEYYALGLPVLATRLPELERVGGPIRLASTDAEFCQCLRAMLDDDSGLKADGAVELARRNTWDQRVEQLSAFLETLS